MNNLVSIIVPIYNSAPFLDKCIQSIINQTYRYIEIILINDGSTDNSGDICNKYAEYDSRIKVVHKNNGGLVSSRKYGVSLCTGEYILYVDGDDWIEPDLIKCYIEPALKYNADVIVSSHNVNLEGRVDILKNTIAPGIYYKDRLISEVYPKMLYTGKFSQFGIFSYSWGKLYKREILLKNQLKVREDITIGEDALCLYPTLLDSNILIILDTALYHYRQRSDSLIKTLRTIEISKMESVYIDLKKTFKSKGFLDIMSIQLQYYLLSLLIINTEGPSSVDNNEIYPFNKILNGKNVVLYGGGTFGQHLYKKIQAHKNYNIAGWIDERFKHYSKLNLPITSINSINTIEYDRILIALMDEDNSQQALLKLIDYGIDASKIIQIPYYNKLNIRELLLEYKINL